MPEEELLLRIQVEGAGEAAVKVERLESGIDRTSKRSKEASKSLGGFSRGLSGLARGFGMLAGTVGVAGVGLGLAEVIKSAENFQDVQKQLGVAVKAAGLDMKEGTKRLSEYSEALSVKGGFTAPENLQSLTTFIRITKNVTKAQQMLSLATNIARGTHKSLTASTRAVMMAESGRLSGLTRLGIILPKNATATKALSILQDRYAGSTKAYSETAAGAMSDFTHTIEQLGEKLGAKLIPPITKVFQFLNKLVDQFERGKGLGGQIRVVFEHIGDALKDIWGWLKKVEFDHLGDQLKQVGKWATDAWHGIQNLVAGFKASKPWAIAVVAALAGLVGAAGAIWLVVKALRAWEAVQATLDILMDANPIGLIIVGLAALAAAFAVVYFKVKGFRDVVNAVFKWVKGAISDVVGFISKHWGLITDIIGGPVKLIIENWKGIISFFKGLVHTVTALFSGMVRGLLAAIKKVTDAVSAAAQVVASIGPGTHITGHGSQAQYQQLRNKVKGDLGVTLPAKAPSSFVTPPKHHALGGMIFGDGYRDDVPFLGKPGEYVATDRMVQDVGPSAMDAWRAGGPPPGQQGAVFEGSIHLHMDGKQVGMALVRQGLQQKALS